MGNKTTAVHFSKFKRYAEDWRAKLGLTDWNVDYRHESEKEDGNLADNKAIILMNRAGMVATCKLNKDWNELEVADVKLDACALHEMLELLLHPLLVLTRCRFNVDEEDLEYETHRIIRRFEYLLVKN